MNTEIALTNCLLYQNGHIDFYHPFNNERAGQYFQILEIPFNKDLGIDVLYHRLITKRELVNINHAIADIFRDNPNAFNCIYFLILKLN